MGVYDVDFTFAEVSQLFDGLKVESRTFFEAMNRNI